MRYALVFTMFGLAACAPAVPDSGSRAGGGVGFDDYVFYEATRAQRDAELSGGGNPVPDGPVIASETVAALDTGADADAPPSGAAPSANNPLISDEQDFAAVSERETIESDRERLNAQRQVYQVVTPTAVPTRPSGARPNIVEFALGTTNAVGEQLYSRSGANATNRFNRACARYASSDLAQEAFLGAGGPERDRKGMDPDGDGFACYWDPTPFRAARAAASSGG